MADADLRIDTARVHRSHIATYRPTRGSASNNSSKAAEHRRTPKRTREVELHMAATFWSAALLRRFG